MHIIIWVLELLITWWIFYPIVVIGLLMCYKSLQDNIFDPRASSYSRMYTLDVGPFVTLVLTVGLLAAYKFGLFAISWQWWLVGAAIYFVMGGIVSTYKWVQVILDFNKPESRVDVQKTIDRAKLEYPVESDRGMGFKSFIVTRHHCLKVEWCGDSSFSVYPDWEKFPLKLWWLYWPFFTLQVVFDPVQRFIGRCVRALRQFYDALARRWSVKG